MRSRSRRRKRKTEIRDHLLYERWHDRQVRKMKKQRAENRKFRHNKKQMANHPPLLVEYTDDGQRIVYKYDPKVTLEEFHKRPYVQSTVNTHRHYRPEKAIHIPLPERDRRVLPVDSKGEVVRPMIYGEQFKVIAHPNTNLTNTERIKVS